MTPVNARGSPLPNCPRPLLRMPCRPAHHDLSSVRSNCGQKADGQSMSKIDVTDFFREYVYGFMRSDIQKQLDLAQSGKGGANVLAALGLIVYTEALGRIRV